MTPCDARGKYAFGLHSIPRVRCTMFYFYEAGRRFHIVDGKPVRRDILVLHEDDLVEMREAIDRALKCYRRNFPKFFNPGDKHEYREAETDEFFLLEDRVSKAFAPSATKPNRRKHKKGGAR